MENKLTADDRAPDSEATGQDVSAFLRYKRSRKSSANFRNTFDLLPIHLFIAMITQYDIYISKLYRISLTAHPNSLESSNKTSATSEILQFTSLEDLRAYLLDREVDDFMRKSRQEQIKKLGGLLGLNICDYLSQFPQLIEAGERRNLFVHTNGIVSKQYIEACAEVGFKSGDEKVGTELDIDPQYFTNAAKIVLVSGIIVGHLVWRKLSPKDLKTPDDALNEVGYELMVDGRYEIASEVFKFAAEGLKKHHDDRAKKTALMNWANATRLAGHVDVAKEILKKDDWSSAAIEFRVGRCTVDGDFDAAAALMLSAGSDHSVLDRISYHEWPLFSDFRKSKQFADSYNKLFGQSYADAIKLDEKEEEKDRLDNFVQSYTAELKDLVAELNAEIAAKSTPKLVAKSNKLVKGDPDKKRVVKKRAVKSSKKSKKAK